MNCVSLGCAEMRRFLINNIALPIVALLALMAAVSAMAICAGAVIDLIRTAKVLFASAISVVLLAACRFMMSGLD